jgi:hypothetical protein
MHDQLMALTAPASAGLEGSMTHTRMAVGLLIGGVALGVVLSGLVWLARQQSRRARILILTKGGAPGTRPGLCTPTGLMRSRGCDP